MKYCILLTTRLRDAFMSFGRSIMLLQLGDAIDTGFTCKLDALKALVLLLMRPVVFVVPYLYWTTAELGFSILAVCLPAILQLSRRESGTARVYYPILKVDVSVADRPQGLLVDSIPTSMASISRTGTIYMSLATSVYTWMHPPKGGRIHFGRNNPLQIRHLQIL